MTVITQVRTEVNSERIKPPSPSGLRFCILDCWLLRIWPTFGTLRCVLCSLWVWLHHVGLNASTWWSASSMIWKDASHAIILPCWRFWTFSLWAHLASSLPHNVSQCFEELVADQSLLLPCFSALTDVEFSAWCIVSPALNWTTVISTWEFFVYRSNSLHRELQ